MKQEYQIQEVQTRSDWNDFIDIPWLIYKGNSAWVPPLRIAVRETLDEKKNPFFKHAQMKAWIARDSQGEPVGRIVGVIDRNHNRFHEEKTAFFGFYEALEDQNLANLLLDSVREWARSHGMNQLRGPMNPSTNHECGLLIEGFAEKPSVMMTYNPPYYATQFETWGLGKAKDLFAYDISSENGISERQRKLLERIKERHNIRVRQLDPSRFDEEIGIIQEIYQKAWEKNWGFVPMTQEEMEHLKKELKLVLDPRIILFAEVNGKIAGWALALPDVNEVFRKIPSGKLLPFGWIKLLWNLKGPGRKKLNRLRVLTLGVLPEYQKLGIGPVLYNEYFTHGVEVGYHGGECSWILEDNIPMNKALEQMQALRSKVYRIYDREI